MPAAKKDSFKILYEDDHILAVHKPAKMASVPAPNIPDYQTLQGKTRAWALREGKDYTPYLLHRLDRQTSGLVLFGKYSKDREALQNMFKEPTTEKTYLALVKWVPKQPAGTIDFPLEARTSSIKVPATSHYRTFQITGNASILEVRIETGRKHQIRKHLAMIGHPLILDRDYGDHRFDNDYQRRHKGKGHFFLHAWKFECVHPFTGERFILVDEPMDLPK